jgi:hypothetical protein
MILSLSSPAANSHATGPKANMISIFWIDQLCINQSDVVEKSEQVRKMHEIYLDATQTYVYLGEPTPDSLTALETCHALSFLATVDEKEIPWETDANLFNKLDYSAIHTMPKYRPFITDRTASTKHLSGSRFSDWLMGSKWFHRTWTIQEIVCSQDPHLRVGTFDMPWATLISACKFAISTKCLASRLTSSGVVEVSMLEELRKARLLSLQIAAQLRQDDDLDEDVRHQLIHCSLVRTIPEVVCLTIQKGVTDPRDKVFAMLNIVSEAFDQDVHPSILSIIDYKLSVRTVYLGLCQIWHAASQRDSGVFSWSLPHSSVRSLSFLDYAFGEGSSWLGFGGQIQHNQFKLPSWVPDWTYIPRSGIFMRGGFRAALPSAEHPCDIHVRFPNHDQFELDEVPLQVRGIQLFAVHAQCKQPRDLVFDGIEPYGSLLSLFKDPYPTSNIGYAEAFSLSVDVNAYPKPAKRDIWIGRFWQHARALGDACDVRRARDSPMTQADLRQHMGFLHFAGMFGSLAGGMTQGRAFLISAGGFMGWGPEETRDGDVILLLFGGRTPYVARPLTNGRYKFLGQCFVFGVMEGQALEGYDEDKVEDFVFV